MEKMNFYTLKMKLNRHKLKFQISNDESSIQLGGATVTFSTWLINVALPLSIGLVFLLLLILGIIPTVRLLGKILVGLPFIIGFVGIANVSNKKKMNKNIKIIEKGKIKIIEKGISKIIESSMIEDFKVIVNKNDQEVIKQGMLVMIDKNQNSYQILGIQDKEVKFLEDDLNYIRDFFMKIIGN